MSRRRLYRLRMGSVVATLLGWAVLASPYLEVVDVWPQVLLSGLFVVVCALVVIVADWLC